MKKKHYQFLQSLGLLIGTSLITNHTQTVKADDVTGAQGSTYEENITTASSPSTQEAPTTSSEQLNDNLQKAAALDLTIVETPTQTFDNQSALQEDYAKQAEAINQTITEYELAQQNYQQQLIAYKENQESLNQYEKDLANYKEYELTNSQFQKELANYQTSKQNYQD